MDNIPIEYHERMMAEQMAMIESLQLIWQILICFAILMTFVSLIINASSGVRSHLRERGMSERRQPLRPRRSAARLCDPVGEFEI